MCKRVALWKRNYISKGGRITFIKCTLARLPLYHMSLIRIPIVVTKRLEKVQINFLWCGMSFLKGSLDWSNGTKFAWKKSKVA